nr:hypothetical protein [Tanacetum cinerariifolium]
MLGDDMHYQVIRIESKDPHLSWRESLDRVENVGFDLVKCYLGASFIEGHTAKRVGLRVADSHTNNHHKDDFTPLETIQRFLRVFGSRSLSSSEGRPSSRIRVDDEEMSFLPREPSHSFVGGSSSALINNEPLLLEVDPLDRANLDQLVENTTNSEGSPVHKEMIIVVSDNVAERIKNQWSIHQESSFAPVEVKAESSAYLTISDDEAMVDNAVNRRARGLLKIVEQLKGEFEVIKEREKVGGQEYEELKAKCEAVMEDFDKNPVVIVLRQKIVSLLTEIETVKRDRVEVVSKVVPYVAMELVRSDKMHVLVGRLVSSAIFYRRCFALEEVAKMKELFDLAKVKGYRPSYKKEHTKVVAVFFSFLSKVIADPYASVETLFSKKPKSPRLLTLTQTTTPAPSAPSQQQLHLSSHHQSLCLLFLKFEGHCVVIIWF